MLATIRPDSWNLPLFVHVLGAMALVGGLLVSSSAVLLARGEWRLLRTGYFTLLAVCLPAYVLMRVGAEWLYARERLDEAESDPAWVGIGYITADIGALLLLVALILGGFGVRRLHDGRTGLVRASLLISVLLLLAYTVTVWAMGAKPD
jgi:peptidoglycan biosynthesis protein MviN/MurJ (putative lipid II flippase)